jgi:hypothetical protein
MLNIFWWLRCNRNAAIRVLCYPAVTVFSMGTLRIGIAGERTDAIHFTGASKNILRMQLSLAEYLLVVAVVSEFALISTSYDSLQQADIGYWLSRSVAIRYFSGHPCWLYFQMSVPHGGQTTVFTLEKEYKHIQTACPRDVIAHTHPLGCLEASLTPSTSLAHRVVPGACDE